jgi:hypothetical protein
VSTDDVKGNYFKKYRHDHPRYCERNTLLQACRNAKARVIAKMDTLKPAPLNKPGAFYLLPLIAKMDASSQKAILIPIAYNPCMGDPGISVLGLFTREMHTIYTTEKRYVCKLRAGDGI